MSFYYIPFLLLYHFILVTEDAELKLREEKIERSRNKSGLNDSIRNILHEINPYPEPILWHHRTVKYVRKTYGKYGSASGVNPSICFPLKEELDDIKEYERVAFPQTITEMIAEAKQKKKEIENRRMQRQKDIVEKMKKLDQWKKDLHNRIQKKENEVKAAKVSNACYLVFNFSVSTRFLKKKLAPHRYLT